MKNKIRVLTLLLSASGLFAANAHADGQGFYIGASAGYSALNTPGGDAFSVTSSTGSALYVEDSSSSDIGGFGGNIFAGYNFNKNFAVEVGYTKYADSNYSSTQSEYAGSAGDYSLVGTPNNASIDYSTSSIDLFAKGTMPIMAQVSGFAKVGVSYVMQGVDYTNPTGTPDISLDSGSFATPESGNTTQTALRPSGALGLSYQATEHLSASIFAQGFLGEGDFSSDSSAIASAYLVGASVSYDFL